MPERARTYFFSLDATTRISRGKSASFTASSLADAAGAATLRRKTAPSDAAVLVPPKLEELEEAEELAEREEREEREELEELEEREELEELEEREEPDAELEDDLAGAAELASACSRCHWYWDGERFSTA